MAIDYWTLVKDFQIGDFVQKFVPGSQGLPPYVGRVVAVMPGIAFLDVQWPFGTERVSPEELIKVNKALAGYLPPSLNFSNYSGLDAVTASTGVPLWRGLELPAGAHLEMAKLMHKGANALQTYDILWHRYRQADDESLRDEVSKFYRVAYNLLTAMLLEQARRKEAAYWAATDRKYRATQQELTSKKLACPKCKQGPMRKTTYKMSEGQRMRLLACPSCLHLVKQTDIMGPDGQPVEW